MRHSFAVGMGDHGSILGRGSHVMAQSGMTLDVSQGIGAFQNAISNILGLSKFQNTSQSIVFFVAVGGIFGCGGTGIHHILVTKNISRFPRAQFLNCDIVSSERSSFRLQCSDDSDGTKTFLTGFDHRGNADCCRPPQFRNSISWTKNLPLADSFRAGFLTFLCALKRM